MATALSSLRQTMMLWIGELTGTTTSAGNSNKLTLVCLDLADKPDDFYIGWYVKMTSGTSSGNIRYVSDFVQSSGTITVSAVFDNQIANSVTFELHRNSPAIKDEAIKRALLTVYPNLYVPYITEELVTGNWLRNGGFATWALSTLPDHWVKSSTPTVAQATAATTVGTSLACLYGASAAKLSAAIGGILQSEGETYRLLDLRGQTVTFKAWALCQFVSAARLQVKYKDDAGTETTSNSSYHSGGSLWELLSLEVTLPSDMREVAFILRLEDAGAIAYYDQARVVGPVNHEYYLPRSGWEDILQVWMQSSGGGGEAVNSLDPCDDMGEFYPLRQIAGWRVDNDGTDRILRIPQNLAHSYRLRLIGRKFLTVPASDSATTELDAPKTDYVIAEAMSRYYKAIAGGLPIAEMPRYQEEQLRWEREAALLRKKHMMPSLPVSGRVYKG